MCLQTEADLQVCVEVGPPAAEGPQVTKLKKVLNYLDFYLDQITHINQLILKI